MNKKFTIMLLLFITATVYADTFKVGDKELVIPVPQGFSRVTQQMDAVHRLSLQMVDPANDQLAYYISISDVPFAIAGELPSLKRTFILKVNKDLKNIIIGSKEFAELKRTIMRQNKELLESVKSKIPGYFERMSKGISEEFDLDFALRLSHIIPLDRHYEADNAWAYSMYINYGVSASGVRENAIVSATATFVNVSGKILFLYCYGPQDELEWTRNASRAWVERIMASNAQPPTQSSGVYKVDWNRIIEKGIVGAITATLIALISGVISIFRKKKNG